MLEVEQLRAKLRDQVKSLLLTASNLETIRAMANDGRLYDLGFRWLQIRAGEPKHWIMAPAETGQWCRDFDRSISSGQTPAQAIDGIIHLLRDEEAKQYWLSGVLQHARRRYPDKTSDEAYLHMADSAGWPLWAIWSLPSLVFRLAEGGCVVWERAAKIVTPTARLAVSRRLCKREATILTELPDGDSWSSLLEVDGWRHFAEIGSVSRMLSKLVSLPTRSRTLRATIELCRVAAIRIEIDYELEIPQLRKPQLVVRRRGALWGQAIIIDEARIAAAIERIAISDADLNPDAMLTANDLLDMVA